MGFACLAALLSAACRPAAPEPPAGKRYALVGLVVAVDRAAARASVAHEDIPGFMPAMTMEFPMGDAATVERLLPGDRIKATLVVAPDNRHWLEDVEVTARPPQPLAAPESEEGAPGDALPDVKLVDQDGRALPLASYRGKALALTFIFTRCPLPEFCPLITSRFSELARALAADEGLRDRARLLSVTFDPAFDTPAVLRDHALRFQPKGRPPFELWRLATGPSEEIRRLASFLGLDYVPDQGSFVHNLRTAVVGADGRLVKVLHGSDWSNDELLGLLRQSRLTTPGPGR